MSEFIGLCGRVALLWLLACVAVSFVAAPLWVYGLFALMAFGALTICFVAMWVISGGKP